MGKHDFKGAPVDLFARSFFLETLVNGKGERVQLHFRQEVLDRYRGRKSCSVKRTDSAGRLKRSGQWMLDFGIGEDDRRIHLALQAFLRLPQREREHWLDHYVTLPLNEKFVQMQLNPSNCFDDGEIRDW